MKKWNITIEAKNEEEAVQLINILKQTFEIAANFNEPLHHISASVDGSYGKELICNVEKI